jgi:hypothetical protein
MKNVEFRLIKMIFGTMQSYARGCNDIETETLKRGNDK